MSIFRKSNFLVALFLAFTVGASPAFAEKMSNEERAQLCILHLKKRSSLLKDALQEYTSIKNDLMRKGGNRNKLQRDIEKTFILHDKAMKYKEATYSLEHYARDWKQAKSIFGNAPKIRNVDLLPITGIIVNVANSEVNFEKGNKILGIDEAEEYYSNNEIKVTYIDKDIEQIVAEEIRLEEEAKAQEEKAKAEELRLVQERVKAEEEAKRLRIANKLKSTQERLETLRAELNIVGMTPVVELTQAEADDEIALLEERRIQLEDERAAEVERQRLEQKRKVEEAIRLAEEKRRLEDESRKAKGLENFAAQENRMKKQKERLDSLNYKEMNETYNFAIMIPVMQGDKAKAKKLEENKKIFFEQYKELEQICTHDTILKSDTPEKEWPCNKQFFEMLPTLEEFFELTENQQGLSTIRMYSHLFSKAE